MLGKQITLFMDEFQKGIYYPRLPSSYVVKMEKSSYKRNVFGVLLTDLSKAFDCMSHELIRVKLNAYCFSLPASGLQLY